MTAAHPHVVKVNYNATPAHGVQSVTTTMFCNDDGVAELLSRLDEGKPLCLAGADAEMYVPVHAVNCVEVRRNAR